MDLLLQVNDLRVHFRTSEGLVKAVNGVTYHVNEGEVVGLVGESGCGKTVTQLSTLQAVKPPGEIVGGEVIFKGTDLLQLPPEGREMSAVRGGQISMILQEPTAAFKRDYTIGRQITEKLQYHLGIGAGAARERGIELLKMVQISDAGRRIDSYPYELSEGMLQRVMMATALSCSPSLIIADEPTTALDVTTQSKLMELMVDTLNQNHASLVLVTNNMGVIARYADRIYVMYAGRIVESGTTKEVFGEPLHPYTRGLLRCVPRLDTRRDEVLETIEGDPADLKVLPETCAFLPRCALREMICNREKIPGMEHFGGEHYAACYVCNKLRSERV